MHWRRKSSRRERTLFCPGNPHLTMWKVPLFNTSFDTDDELAMLEAIRSGWVTMGERTLEFEDAFARFIGAEHAIAVSSGTAALHLAAIALGVGPGDEVICPSLTFVAGANSILYTGATPVFADITGDENFNVSPSDIEAKVTQRTKAISVTHYAGYPCDMEPILRTAEKHGLSVIEDCAHAPGADYKGQRCGTMGDVGCFSFFSNKNMTTAEGGMLTTNNEALAKKFRLLRSHGMTAQTLVRHRGHAFSYDVVDLGFNYRIDEIRSAIGIVQLGRLEEANKKRAALAGLYAERLSGLEGLTVPFGSTPHRSAHHILPVLLGTGVDRSALMEHLKGSGIQSSIHYPPIHRFKYYRSKLGDSTGALPVTEDVAERELTLPLYPTMGEAAVNYVCQSIAGFLDRRTGKK